MKTTNNIGKIENSNIKSSIIRPKADILIESSFEVCNKVGGIYTVVTSKAAIINEAYLDYFLVGPYYQDKAFELEQQPPPEFLKKPFAELAAQGINCVFGKWQVKGEPYTILVDFKNKLGDANDIKKQLWESYQVDTLFSNYDFTEPMVWAWCVGKLIEKISENTSKKIVTHFHEWLAGISLLYLKKYKPQIPTVFTTHATMLGRSIAGTGDKLYSIIDTIQPYEEARRRGVIDKFTTELACAKYTNIFTTVSEITGYEAEKLLGRKPEVLVLNGLDINRFPTFEETSIMHRKNRDIMREFLSYYFEPYYDIDFKESLNMFIFGRNEFKNKGVDIFIKSLSKLNKELTQTDKTVFAFFFIPCSASSIRFDLLDAKNKYHQIKEMVENESEALKQNIISNLLSDKDAGVNLLSKNFMQTIKKNVMHFKKLGLPPLSTHNVDENEPMLKAFRENNLLNREEDKVKVILYPIYVSNNDGLLNLSYYEAITAGHLGVFPSYYEPWGYTPLESAALGVPAVTSDLAGFGRYIKDKATKGGIFVLDRQNVSEEKSVENFKNMMLDYVKLTQQKRVEQKIIAKELAAVADWSVLAKNYIIAQNMAQNN